MEALLRMRHILTDGTRSHKANPSEAPKAVERVLGEGGNVKAGERYASAAAVRKPRSPNTNIGDGARAQAVRTHLMAGLLAGREQAGDGAQRRYRAPARRY